MTITTVTFKIEPEDKQALIRNAQKERLSLSSYCRTKLIQINYSEDSKE